MLLWHVVAEWLVCDLVGGRGLRECAGPLLHLESTWLVRCGAWLAGLHLAVPNGQGLVSAEDLRQLLLLAPIGMQQPHNLVCFT